MLVVGIGVVGAQGGYALKAWTEARYCCASSRPIPKLFQRIHSLFSSGLGGWGEFCQS